MSEQRSRREFFGLTAAGLAGTLTPEWLRDARSVSRFAERAPEPELIVFNAKVYTMDPRLPVAEAFAVKGGRFVTVGKSADVRGLAGKRTQLLDANQRTVVTGFMAWNNHSGGPTLL
jgi:hypothetical protein